MLVDVAILALLGVCDDAAGNSSCYLTAEDVLAIGSGDHNVGMLVLLACLWQPRLVVVAVLVLDEFHLAVDGEPVGMHIPQTHKDTDHESLVMEILVLFDFLNHHDATVGRSYDDVLGVVGAKVADGAAIEVGGDTIYGAEHNKECPEGYLCVEHEPQHNGYGYQSYGTIEKGVGTLAVYSDLL